MNCKKCHIVLLGNEKACPLCGTPLTGTVLRESAFPRLRPTKGPNRFAICLTAFITLLVAGICVVINASTTPNKWWSLFVVGGLCSLWFAFGVAFYKRRNILKMIAWQTVCIVLLAVVWDLMTGFHKWSLEFVMPNLFSTALVAMLIVAKIMKLDARSYLIYLVIDIVLGCSVLFLLLFGGLTIWLPCVICLVISLLFLSALILFQGKTLLSELNRRMHI